MKFSIGRLILIKMLEQVAPAAAQRKRTSSFVRLMACEARVFVMANGITAGVEALVLRDGSCMLDRRRFIGLLKTYHPKQHLTFDLTDRVLRFGSTEIGVPVVNETPRAPDKFQTYTLDDSWIAHPEKSSSVGSQGASRRSRPSA